MSEPIQSISQGNYVLATQQEVSHDNTLSGNGTSASPLGVVPGYNETLLYSGNVSIGNKDDIPLNEVITNFERIKVIAAWSYNQNFGDPYMIGITEIPTEFSAHQFNIATFGAAQTNQIQTNSVNFITFGNYYFKNASTIGVQGAYRDYNAGGAFNSTDTLKIVRVIGINRKPVVDEVEE